MRYYVILPLIATALLASFVGCSDRIVVVDEDDPGLVQGGINPGDTGFEIVLPTAGTAQHPFTGPFILRGNNIHYDGGIGALLVDLTIENNSPNTYPLPIKLEFVTLLPPNVRILNPSNDIQGPGAMIQFEFANRDIVWTPGETSLPRSVQFGIDPGVSIGFAVRLHVGPPPDRGTISGVVWDDANEDGVRDIDELGLEGRGVLLAYADSLLDCVPPTDCPVIQHATTGPDGRYAFDGLDGGFYLVMLVRDRCSNPTTPPEIQVVLVETGGVVNDFPYGDFGVKPLRVCCGFANGDFSDGESYWVNESEGPGLGSRQEGIVDVDGREHVLHLDSRAGGNYYLFRTQRFGSCGILDHALRWEWKLASIERSYGLAAVFIEFFDGAGAPLGHYLVRRHTGDFNAYLCDSMVADYLSDNPNFIVGCEEMIGTSFDWMTSKVVFDEDFFAGLSGPKINPNTVAEIKMWVESYNNAGAGVDAYFDNFAYGTAIVTP
jgi:hypothetical protein